MVMAWFVKYDSLEACMERYAKILLLDRYKQTIQSKDWWDSTNYVRINGYATSPFYTEGLRDTILSAGLYRYDWVHAYSEQILPGYNFSWGETFSNIFHKGRKYVRVIEPYPEYWENVIKLATQLQIVRFKFGRKIIVNSWFRIPSYNMHPSIGGEPKSQHLTANAVDVVRNASMGEFIKAFENDTNVTGIGIMQNALHVDLKPGPRRKWYY
jgi:hypothetical protein